jgi:hypothetical protein
VAAALFLGAFADAEADALGDACAVLRALGASLVLGRGRASAVLRVVGALPTAGRSAWCGVLRRALQTNDAASDVLVGALLQVASVRGAAVRDAELRAALWQLVASRLAAVRTRDERGVVLQRFAPLLGEATAVDIGGTLMPVIDRQTRRAPELSLGVLACVLRSAPRSLDVGDETRGAALQLALPELRSKNDLCRADAVAVVDELAWRAALRGAADLRAVVVAAVLEPLLAERDAAARLALIAALRVLVPRGAQVASVPDRNSLAAHIVAQLAGAAEGETNEVVRVALLDAVAAWAAHAAGLVPAHAKLVAKFLKLAGPPAARANDAALLRGVAAALGGAEPVAVIGETVDGGLRALLRDAAVGPASFALQGVPPAQSAVVTDSILALTALARTAFHAGAPELVPPNALLFSLGNDVPVAAATVDAVVAAVRAGAPLTPAQVANALVRCLLASDGATRRAALHAVAPCEARVPASAAALVAALRVLFETTGVDAATWSPGSVRCACSTIAAASVHAKRPLGPRVATDLLLLANHHHGRDAETLRRERAHGSLPRVTGRARWWLSVSRLLGVDVDCGQLVATLRIPVGDDELEAPAAAESGKGKAKKQADPAEAARALQASRRVASEWREAACDALAVLARGAIRGERALLDGVMDGLMVLLSAESLAGVSRRDVRVFRAAPDVVVPEDAGKFVARIVNDANAAERAAEEKRQALASQARTRARVLRLVAQARVAIAALEDMIIANPALMCDEAARIVRGALPLASIALTTSEAARLIARTMHATPLSAAVSAACIAALLAVSSANEALRRTPESAELVRSAVQQLRDATAATGRPLGAATLSACVPLLHEAVNGGHMFTVLESALTVIELHAAHAADLGSDSEYPADDLIATLRQLLSTEAIPPRMVARAAKAIDLLAHAVRPSQLLAVTAGLALPSAAARLASLSVLHIALKHITAHAMLSAIDAMQKRAAAIAAGLISGDDAGADAAAAAASRAPLAAEFTASLWTLQHDANAQVAAHARELWSLLDVQPCKGSAALGWLSARLIVRDDAARAAAGRALGAALAIDDSEFGAVFDALGARFDAVPTPPEADQYMDLAARRERDALALANQRVRQGQVQAACGLVLMVAGDEAKLIGRFRQLTAFLAARAFADPVAAVRETALSGALAIVEAHGAQHHVALLDAIRANLAAKSGGGGSALDNVRTGFVVMTGSVALFLPPRDARTKLALLGMIDTLRTPSESVQRTVCTALARLTRPMRGAVDAELVQELVGLVVKLMRSDDYGERRGAAFGLAGLARGLGTRALTDYGVMPCIGKSLGDLRSPSQREGALFAIERLSLDLGHLFEPYVMPLINKMLQRLADANADVRDAGMATTRAVMGQMSGFGVRHVVPMIIRALRSNSDALQKVGAIELLGSMAYVQPRQLSLCLPQIVPRLAKLTLDIEGDVGAAARDALSRIGAVIRNPDLQAVVPLLLNAIAEPDDATAPALAALLAIRFVHRIDAPSLSVVMPLLMAGMNQRDTKSKRAAVQIAGNMTVLADAADLEPYVAGLLPMVRELLFDAVPDARAAAARALGQLAVPLVGTSSFKGLVSWLRKFMRSNDGSVERSGAAQGLAHVVAAVRDSDGGAVLGDAIAASCQDGRSRQTHVREGALCFFVFLPDIVGDGLSEHLGTVLDPVLAAFADEDDIVRDTAQRAAKSVVRQFTRNQRTLNETLLPALELGLFNDEWRVRGATVTLMSETLQMIADQFDDTELTEEEVAAAAAAAAEEEDEAAGADAEAEAAAESGSEAAPKASKADEKEAALASLRLLMRKLAQFNNSDASKAATKLRRDVRKQALKAGVSASGAINAAFQGESAIMAVGKSGDAGDGAEADGGAGGRDDDNDDDEDAAAEAERKDIMAQSAAKLSKSERSVRTEQRLRRALDETRRKRALAALFVALSDTTDAVSEAAGVAWKALVTNTPRTLSEILVTLLEVVVESLSGSSEERSEISSRALANLVRKVGDRVLPTLLTALAKQATDADADTRASVVFALSEVTNASTGAALGKHSKLIAGVIRSALQDESDDVREAGGLAFDAFFGQLGNQAVGIVLPGLLELLDQPAPLCDRALDGIRHMVAARPQSIAPLVLPRVAATPLSPFRAEAIATICGAIGELLADHLNNVLPPLLIAAGAGSGGEALSDAARTARDAAAAAAEKVCGVIDDEATAHAACVLLITSLRQRDTYKAVKAPLRVATANAMAAFFRDGADVIGEEDREAMFDELVRAMADTHVPVQSAAWGAVSQLTETLPKEELPLLLETLRQALADVQLDLRRRACAEDPKLSLDDDTNLPDVELAGLNLPKGLKPMLAIVLQALSYGSAEQRAAAADTMARLAALTSRDALKPFGIAMVGPLIRVVADRFPAPVKCAILGALRVLLGKCDSLKQFVTQLQTTFVKSLADPDDAVRMATAQALEQSLTTIGPARVDTLLTQILAVVEQYFDSATLLALHATLTCAGANDGKLPAAGIDTVREALLTRTDDAPTNAGDDFEDSQSLLWLARALGATLARSDAVARAAVLKKLKTQAGNGEADAWFVAQVEKELASLLVKK